MNMLEKQLQEKKTPLRMQCNQNSMKLRLATNVCNHPQAILSELTVDRFVVL